MFILCAKASKVILKNSKRSYHLIQLLNFDIYHWYKSIMVRCRSLLIRQNTFRYI